MVLHQARAVCWKKWAAKHEYEELKESIWLEPALALLRKKTKGEWTEKHRNVARKLVLEGGWVQKKLYDINWWDKSVCQACHKEEGTEKHRLYQSPRMVPIQTGDPRCFQEVGAKSANFKRGVEMSKRCCHASSC